MKKIKSLLKILLVSVIFINLVSCGQKSLPLPETEEGMRGQLGIDKNINEKTIDEYLNRDDSVYYDMRMIKDEADYEAIGGDSYLSGYIKGFEVIPYPYLCNVTGLPEEVGQSYSGDTLFRVDDRGIYVANYEESLHIIKSLFPEDKNIFLMCGGGGYAGMCKKLLVALGYDSNKIYNVGGYWYYDGENKVDLSYTENGKTYYDFTKLDYHHIDFSALHKINESDQKDDKDNNNSHSSLTTILNNDELMNIIEKEDHLVVYAYLSGCAGCASFSPIVNDYIEKNNVKIYGIDMQSIAKDDNPITRITLYTPAVFVFENGEVIGHLDAMSDEDYPYYQSYEAFDTWLKQYLDIEDIKDECQRGCSITD